MTLKLISEKVCVKTDTHKTENFVSTHAARENTSKCIWDADSLKLVCTMYFI